MKPLQRLTVHMRCTTAILAPILASAVHAQEFSALQARFNVLTQVGNHITNANVVESQTQISHGYVTEKSTYFFPNHFSSTNFPSISNIKIDGSAPIFFATHQLVDKGVSTAPFVELFFRTHNFSGASAIQSAMLSPHNEGTIEELNLLNYAQNWSVTELNQSRFANASKLEYWLKFTLPNGTVRWDSNDGKNYWVDILPLKDMWQQFKPTVLCLFQKTLQTRTHQKVYAFYIYSIIIKNAGYRGLSLSTQATPSTFLWQ